MGTSTYKLCNMLVLSILQCHQASLGLVFLMNYYFLAELVDLFISLYPLSILFCCNMNRPRLVVVLGKLMHIFCESCSFFRCRKVAVVFQHFTGQYISTAYFFPRILLQSCRSQLSHVVSSFVISKLPCSLDSVGAYGSFQVCCPLCVFNTLQLSEDLNQR